MIYTIILSQPRKLGFGNGKGELSAGLWSGGSPFAAFTWGVSASSPPKPQVYVAP